MEESTPLRPRALLAVVAAVLLALSFSTPAQAVREIPVGGANVNDQNLANANYRLAIRFVLDRDTSLYRFVSGFKAEGANWWPEGSSCSGIGSGCYGAGNGGTINAQLVTVKADGTPDLSNVIASETFSPETRYAESMSAAGIPGGAINLLWYVNTGGVRLNGDTMYAMVYRNVVGPIERIVFKQNSQACQLFVETGYPVFCPCGTTPTAEGCSPRSMK